jgi:hypothetical protein
MISKAQISTSVFLSQKDRHYQHHQQLYPQLVIITVSALFGVDSKEIFLKAKILKALFLSVSFSYFL